MNILEVTKMVSKFIGDPHQGIEDLEKMMMPQWLLLEDQAGGRLSCILSRSDDAQNVTVSLWVTPAEGPLMFWKAFTLYDLLDMFKNPQNNSQDATVSALPITQSSPAAIVEESGTGTDEPGYTAAATTGDQATAGTDPGAE